MYERKNTQEKASMLVCGLVRKTAMGLSCEVGWGSEARQPGPHLCAIASQFKRLSLEFLLRQMGLIKPISPGLI